MNFHQGILIKMMYTFNYEGENIDFFQIKSIERWDNASVIQTLLKIRINHPIQLKLFYL